METQNKVNEKIKAITVKREMQKFTNKEKSKGGINKNINMV